MYLGNRILQGSLLCKGPIYCKIRTPYEELCVQMVFGIPKRQGCRIPGGCGPNEHTSKTPQLSWDKFEFCILLLVVGGWAYDTGYTIEVGALERLNQRGVGMNKVVMLHAAESEEILQAAIQKEVPTIMSYLSKGKWHVAKVLLTSLGSDRLRVMTRPPSSETRTPRPHPINIQVNQPVGISFKYAYGKFVFDTTVVGLEPSPEPTNGGTIVLSMPRRIEMIQRRNYFRVGVPKSLKVNVVLWHRSRRHEAENHEFASSSREPGKYYQGKLVDISAGGAQIVIARQSASNQGSFDAGRQDFKKGQFIGLRFTPMPYEMPLMCNAQIRNILPTADNKNICLGLQIVGLEASPEGREVLSRLVGVVERYHQINQSSARQQDMQSITKIEKVLSQCL